MKKKIMAVTLCLAMVSTFAVGCGQKNETDSGKSEEKSSGKVEIEFVQVKREAAESYTKVIEAFEKENPDIVIKQNVVPDAQEVLMTRASSDSLPDMMNHWPTDAQFVQFEDEGLLLDLSEKDYMKNIDSKYLDAVKAKDGKNYIAPYNVNFMGVYYNKDKFEEAGYTMPTKWDELIALAEEIKAKGETPFILPNKDSWTVFMSVMTNEANLIKRFGITTVPISPVEICNRARKILEEKGKEYIKYEEEFVRKFPDGENYQQICATKLAVQELMEENNCSVAAFECWSAFPTLMGLCPCVVLGEMADNGMPLSCETDINGAITLAILRACNLFEESEFLADLTIRHPQNDNAELLWHCGPFPYSLKKDGVEAKLVDGQERFELKQGDLTVCRFDDVDGEYYLFAGEAKTTTGPETNGTYVWMETDNWKRWEEKLMFGPYIHHLGCVYGHYLPVLREVSRYLGIHFDNAHEQGIYSL